MKRKYTKGARLVYTIYHYAEDGNRTTMTACERGSTQPVASVVIAWDDTCAYVGDLIAQEGAPFAAVHHLCGCVSEYIRDFLHLPGVLIHTEGENTTRRFYRRLGFRHIPEIPGLMVARVEDMCAYFEKIPKDTIETEKPPA